MKGETDAIFRMTFCHFSDHVPPSCPQIRAMFFVSNWHFCSLPTVRHQEVFVIVVYLRTGSDVGRFLIRVLFQPAWPFTGGLLKHEPAAPIDLKHTHRLHTALLMNHWCKKIEHHILPSSHFPSALMTTHEKIWSFILSVDLLHTSLTWELFI